ncbi:MAG: hypothetical protein ABFS35_03890 [Bacteroidota bacterium]
MNSIKKISFLLLVYALNINNNVQAQSMDCGSILKYRKASYPFVYNNLSKSAVCTSGKTYEFIVPLESGNEYRLSFFASSVFNHHINFRVIDLNTNEQVLNLPGESENDEICNCALRDYFHSKLNKLVHPYYDFIPTNSTNIKIIIDIPSIDGKKPINNSSIYQGSIDKISGCVTIFIQDKKAENLGFK